MVYVQDGAIEQVLIDVIMKLMWLFSEHTVYIWHAHEILLKGQNDSLVLQIVAFFETKLNLMQNVFVKSSRYKLHENFLLVFSP